ncbi:MAG: ABC transporter permease [Anaerolineaceae bacterium]|nr:ABC transporter permease [Anaerolineaceae bacterium]
MLEFLGIFTTVEFYIAVVQMTTPILLAAMGGLIAERSGIIPFGMEGMMLMGTVGGVIGSGLTDRVEVGLLLAMLAGVFIAVLYAIMAVSVGANQVVTAVALNMGALGLSSLLYVLAFAGGKGEVIEDVIRVRAMPLWKIPVLGEIPFIGKVLFNQYPLVYLAFFMAPVVWFILYRTSWGLKIRAVGEHPHAADTVGIHVLKVRYLTLIVCGMLAGLAGAFLSIGAFNAWQENMTSGRGFIAYTSIVFGRWEPIGAFLGSFLFGAADALQLRMQTQNIQVPFQVMVAFPYIVTVIVLVLSGKSAKWPAASGEAFKRESK